MKLSLKQLKKCISTLERECLYTDQSTDDVEVKITIAEGDPGNGRLISSVIMEAASSDLHLEKNSIIAEDVKIEMFEKHEKMDPVLTVNISKKITR